jgi:hypothetical protein
MTGPCTRFDLPARPRRSCCGWGLRAALLLATLFGASASRAANVLLVISSSTINASESARKTSFEGWGHTVTTIEDSSSQASFDTAVASANVVYVPGTIQDWDLLYKLRTAACGVITETPGLDTEFGFTTSDGYTESGTQLLVVDDTHEVMSGFSNGVITILSSAQSVAPNGNTLAAGMQELAERNSGMMALGVIDTGGTLANTYSGNSTASGRRVRMPWANITWSALNSNGLLIAEQAIDWGAGGGSDDLLLHWKLNETSGTTANDSSANNRDGTVVGTASWITGRRHNAFDFNGSTKIEATTLCGSPSSFTLSCWARIDATDTNAAEGVSVGDYIVLRPHEVGSNAPSTAFYRGSSAWVTLAGTSNYIGRGWHHFAATFDDAGNSLKLYIDGVNVASTTTSYSISWSGLGTKTRAGSHGNTNTLMDMDGGIDDVRVYDRALSQSEIIDVYGLVGHWKQIETSGTTATDSSGKSLNGTYTNSPTLAQAGPYPGAGQYAPSYDGTNDYVNGAAATNYSFDDGFSIAGWINLDAYLDGAAMLQCGATTNACELAFSGTGQVKVSGRSSGGMQTYTSTTTVPRGKWKHVVGTYDGSTFKVYVDGQLDSTSSNAFTVTAGSGNLTLAASLEGTDQYLDGRLHDVRLYNRALVAEEVADLYGLVGWWKLNETSGTLANDSSLSDNDGTYANSPTLAQAGPYPGAGQNAPQFDGANDHVATGAIYAELGDGFSIAVWARPTSTGSWARFVDFGNGSSVDNVFFGRSTTTTDLIVRLHDGSLGTGSITATGAVENNLWHHYLATCDNSGNAVLYRDGQQVASGNIGTPAEVKRTANYIGRSNWAADAYYQGRMQDVRLYNRPLSTAEVAEVYGLVGHWKFNEGSGTSLADSSGAGASAAFNGGAPDWISGAYGNALDFNGTTDDTITSDPFTPPSTGAVAFWFRSNGPPAVRQRHFGLSTNFETWQDPDGRLSFDICTDGFQGGFITTTPLYTSGRWYHVTGVYDSADESYQIYLNGELHKSGISTWAINSETGNQLSFGTRTGTTDRFAGALDDIRVYNRKLSPWEAYQVYGLMAWYKLDETSGTTATDSTGRGQDGTFTGSPTLNVSANGASSQGTAVAFNGSNYMEATGLYDKSASVSASAWVRLDGVDSLGGEVVSLGDCFVLRLNSGSSGVAAKYYNGSAWVTATASQLVLNTGWHHFAAVLDGGNTLKLYIDGIEAASTAASGAISYTGQGANTRVASHANGFTNVDLTGRVDDVRVFNRAMTSLEVYYLYRGSRINGLKITKWVESR